MDLASRIFTWQKEWGRLQNEHLEEDNFLLAADNRGADYTFGYSGVFLESDYIPPFFHYNRDITFCFRAFALVYYNQNA
jgi:hypothetical protein